MLIVQVFQVVLALVLLFGMVVVPLALILSDDVSPEDLKRDVRKGL